MSRQKLPGGKWRDLSEPAPAVLFQRHDGSVMAPEEVADLVKVTKVGAEAFRATTPATRPKRGVRVSEQELERNWRAVEEHGTIAAAARALGMSQTSMHTRIHRYMRLRGIEELPRSQKARPEPAAEPSGSLTKAAAAIDQALNGRHKFAAVYEPLEAQAHADALRDAGEEPAEQQAEPREGDGPAAFLRELIGERKVFTHTLTGNFTESPEDHRIDPVVLALVDWLAEEGPEWTQDKAERWLKAFTAVVDLVYPVRA